MRKYLFILAFLVMPVCAHAQYTTIDRYIESVDLDAKRVEAMTGSEFKDTYPHASCYYDDLVVHYEDDEQMRDAISEGIR